MLHISEKKKKSFPRKDGREGTWLREYFWGKDKDDLQMIDSWCLRCSECCLSWAISIAKRQWVTVELFHVLLERRVPWGNNRPPPRPERMGTGRGAGERELDSDWGMIAKISSCCPSFTISRQSASPAGFFWSQKVNLFPALSRTKHVLLLPVSSVWLEFLKCERKDKYKNCFIDFLFKMRIREKMQVPNI